MRRNRLLSVIVVAGIVAVGGVAFVASPATDSAQAEQEVVTATASTTTTQAGPTPAEVEAFADAVNLNTWNTAVWVHKTNEAAWIEATNERLAAEEAARQLAASERAAAAKAEAAANPAPAPSPSPAPVAEQGTGRCGGDLPPCYVMMRESGGNIRAQNPTSSASGKWQFIRSTWAGFGGYAEAYLAPESVQDAKARILWAGGAGCGHWSAC